MLHTHAHTPTDKFNNGTLYATRNEETFLPEGKNDLITSIEENEARRPHTCSRPCVFEEKTKLKKKQYKSRSTENAPRKPYNSPATATNSRRRATKHLPRVSPYSLASIDPGFVEIGLVQLPQSVKTTNVTHTLTDTQTD